MNRKLVLISVVSFVSSIGFASARGFGDFNGITQQVISNLKSIFTPLFESLLNTSSYDDFFFAKILLLLLLFVVVSTVIKKVPLFNKTKGMGTVVALVVSILSVRYISSEGFIAGILLPYGALGIAITTFLPFLIYFSFIHNSGAGGFGRRIGWIFYGIIFISVWLTRPEGQISDTSSWIYFWGIVAVAISLIFDKNIHGYFKSWEINAFYRGANQRTIAALQAEYLNIVNVDTPEAGNRRRSIETQLKNLHAKLP